MAEVAASPVSTATKTAGPARVRSAATAGVIATFVSLTAGYWIPAVGLIRLDFASLNGNLLVPDTTAVSFAWTVGLVHTCALGAILAVVYSAWVRQRLPGSAWLRGAIWGAVVGVVSGLTIFPLLYGAGAFGLAWDPAAPIALAIWHLVWGLTLGGLEQLRLF